MSDRQWLISGRRSVEVSAQPPGRFRMWRAGQWEQPRHIQATFTSAVPVLPTTNISQATSFYGQPGFQVLHKGADNVIVKRDAVELHMWLCPDRSLAENSSCRIQVAGIEALYQEYLTNGLLTTKAAVRDKPWETKGFVVFDLDRVLITFVERVP